MKLTDEQIKSRPVLLELNYGANIMPLHYMVIKSQEYDQLMSMTAKEAVNFILDNYENSDNNCKELEKRIRAFIKVNNDTYSIQLPRNTLCYIRDQNDKILDDKRNEPIKIYLEDAIDGGKNHLWAASMYLMEKTVL
jgi:hypothetical protein